MRNRFDAELERLGGALVDMGSMAEQALGDTIAALKDRDYDKARALIANADRADQAERSIESACLKLLLQQQPVARDLRTISAALKMVTDLERIYDQAGDLAEICLRFEGQEYIKEPTQISQMADTAGEMVKQSIDAYVRRDTELALRVIDRDDRVDELFTRVKNDLVDILVRDHDRAKGDQVVDFLMIAKYIERIADHAVNIADWVIFSVTGEHRGGKVL